MEVRIVGNYTEPRTWGVYRVKHDRGSPTYHFGNHPVRQRELVNEYGNAELLELHLDRESARQHKQSLMKWSRCRRPSRCDRQGLRHALPVQ